MTGATIPVRKKGLDLLNYPSNIVMGQSFTDYGLLDFKSNVTQELYAALASELDAILNGLKSVEDALNDAAARMQAILDSAGKPVSAPFTVFWVRILLESP